MNKPFRVFAALATMTVVGAAQAITFTNVLVNGNAATWGTIGSTGLYVQLPGHMVTGLQTKALTVTYTVTASAGNWLTNVSLEPNGAVVNATASIAAIHSGGPIANFFQTNPTDPQILGTSSTALPNLVSSNVNARIQLTGNSAIALGKLSIYNAIYTEQPVPEPATVGALILGFAGLAARRRKGAAK